MRSVGVVVACLALVGTGCGAGGGSGGAEYTFKVADSFPKGHVISEQITKKYMADVEKASGGRIDFEYFPAEQLGKAADLLDLTEGGATDIAYILPLYYSEQMPLGGVAGLPGAYSSSEEAGPAFLKLAKGPLYDAEIEKHHIRPLFAFTGNEYQVATSKKQVRTTADMRGLRVRTAGGYMEMTARKLGAVAVSLAAPEMYQAMERGTIDATFISAESIEPYGLDSIVECYTTNLSLGGFGGYYAITESKYGELPEDLQKVMIEQGTKVTESGGRALLADKQQRLKKFEASGMTLTEVSTREQARFEAVSEQVQQAWVTDMEKRGLPGRSILTSFDDLVAG